MFLQNFLLFRSILPPVAKNVKNNIYLFLQFRRFRYSCSVKQLFPFASNNSCSTEEGINKQSWVHRQWQAFEPVMKHWALNVNFTSLWSNCICQPIKLLLFSKELLIPLLLFFFSIGYYSCFPMENILFFNSYLHSNLLIPVTLISQAF